MSAGIKVFTSMEAAKAAGFEPFERIAEGYLVRRDDGKSYALAIVKLQSETAKAT